MKCRLFLLAVVSVPLSSLDEWKQMGFGHVKENHVTVSPKGLRVEVDQSSSPLLYLLNGPTRVRSVQIEGRVNGFPNLPPDKLDGDRGADDYALRVGLALEGEKGTGWLQRLFAPRWVKEMLKLRPDSKFERVVFKNIAQRRGVGFQEKRGLVEETVGFQVTLPGTFSLDIPFHEQNPALALWIHADGDDTRSRFSVDITALRVVTEESALPAK